MKVNPWLIGGIIILAVVGAFFGLSSLSTIGDVAETMNPGDEFPIPYTCDVPNDCVTNMVNDGALLQEDVNEFKDLFEILCESNSCMAVLK